MKFAVTADGDLVIDQPMYVAVRQAVWTQGQFDTLGTAAADQPAKGDLVLEEYNQRLK